MRDIQVEKGHYLTQRYNHRARWISYWQQIDLVLGLAPASVLEIGMGSGVVKDYLSKCGTDIKTLDIDSSLRPDFVGSVQKMPFSDGAFECVLAAEILEHLPFSEFAGCLGEISRVSKKYAVISLPDSRRTLINFYLKLPLLPALKLFWQIPSFKEHKFNGQHYWELGKRGFGLKTVEEAVTGGRWKIKTSFTSPDVPTKHFFVLEK